MTVTEIEGLVVRSVAPRAGGPPHPTALLLHGRGADEEDLLGLAPALDPRLLVVSVRAPLVHADGGYCWYRLRAKATPDPMDLQASLARLAALLGALPGPLAVDPAHLYLLGFSQGAVVSMALLQGHPERIAGAVLLSGFPPPGVPPEGAASPRGSLAGKPIFAAHGTRDRVIDIDLGRRLRDMLGRLGVDLTYHEYEMDHQIGAPELAHLAAWFATRLGSPGPRSAA